MAYNPLDDLAAMPGAAGDVARQKIENPSLPTETPQDTANRQALEDRSAQREEQQNQRIQRISGADLTSRGIPSYRDQNGTVSPVTDSAGQPLTSFDKKNNVAWDSLGKPVSLKYGESGPPQLNDPYAAAPVTTDMKTGDQYKAPAGLPWQWTGQDADIAAKAQAVEKNKAIKDASSALGSQLTAEHGQLISGQVDYKHARGQLEGLVPALSMPDMQDADLATTKKAIDQTFDAQLKSPEANAKTGFLGWGGDTTTDAQHLQAQIQQQRQAAHDAAEKAFDLKDKISGLKQTVEKQQSARAALTNVRANEAVKNAAPYLLGTDGKVYFNEQKPFDGMQAAQSARVYEPKPGELDAARTEQNRQTAISEALAGNKPYQIDPQTKQIAIQDPAKQFDALQTAARDGVIPPPSDKDLTAAYEVQRTSQAIAQAKLGQKTYKVDGGNIQFNPTDPAASLNEAAKDGVFTQDKANELFKSMQPVMEKQKELQDLVNRHPDLSKALALAHGATGAGAFWAGGAAAASLSTTGNVIIGAAQPELAWATVPIAEAVEFLAGGTVGVMLKNKLENALGQYSQAVKDFSNSAEAHPLYDQAGNLVSLAVGAGLTSFPKLARAAGIVSEEAGPMAAAKLIAGRAGAGAAGGAAFEGVLRPAFDAARYAAADAMGIPHDQFQAPTASSVLTNAAIGAMFSGHGITFKDYDENALAGIMQKGLRAAATGQPLESALTQSEIEAFNHVNEKLGQIAATGQQFVADPTSFKMKVRQAILAPDRPIGDKAMQDYLDKQESKWTPDQRAVVESVRQYQQKNPMAPTVEAYNSAFEQTGKDLGKTPNEVRAIYGEATKPARISVTAGEPQSQVGLHGGAGTPGAPISPAPALPQEAEQPKPVMKRAKGRVISPETGQPSEVPPAEAPKQSGVAIPDQTAVVNDKGDLPSLPDGQKYVARGTGSRQVFVDHGQDSPTRYVPTGHVLDETGKAIAASDEQQKQEGFISPKASQSVGEPKEPAGQAKPAATGHVDGYPDIKTFEKESEDGKTRRYLVDHPEVRYDTSLEYPGGSVMHNFTDERTAKGTVHIKGALTPELLGSRIQAKYDAFHHRPQESGEPVSTQPAKTSTIDTAAHKAATSPKASVPAPSVAQKEAGNYRMGHINVGGMHISVENPEGSIRTNMDIAKMRERARSSQVTSSSIEAVKEALRAHDAGDAETFAKKSREAGYKDAWANKMTAHYGYFKRSEGADGDHVDVFVKPGTPEDYKGPVYVVAQKNTGGQFDEHKIIVGVASEQEAKDLYHSNYAKGWTGFDGIEEYPSVEDFRQRWHPNATTKNEPERQPEQPAATTAPVQQGKASVSESQPRREYGQPAIGASPEGSATPVHVRPEQAPHGEAAAKPHEASEQTPQDRGGDRLAGGRPRYDEQLAKSLSLEHLKPYQKVLEETGTSYLEGKTVKSNTSGLTYKDEKIVLEPEKTAKTMNAISEANGKPEEWLRHAVDEELSHAFFVGSEMSKEAALRIESNLTESQRAAIDKVRARPMSAFQRGAEWVRLLDQLRRLGSYTEQFIPGRPGIDDLTKALKSKQSEQAEQAVNATNVMRTGKPKQQTAPAPLTVTPSVQPPPKPKPIPPQERPAPPESSIDDEIIKGFEGLDSEGTGDDLQKRIEENRKRLAELGKKIAEFKNQTGKEIERIKKQSEARKKQQQALSDKKSGKPTEPLHAIGVGQIPIPRDRVATFLDLAYKLLDAGINTPDKLAVALDRAVGERAHKYTQSLWDALTSTGEVARGEHDWEEIYGRQEKRKANPYDALSDWVYGELKNGNDISKASLLPKADELFGGTQNAGKYTQKDAFDALEKGVNNYILDTKYLHDFDAPAATIEALDNLIQRLPTQTNRTEEQNEWQQFSTPPPLAFAAAWLANIRPGEQVLEPSAGVGGLAIFAKAAGAKVHVNELANRRNKLLQGMGFESVHAEDAENLNSVLPANVKPEVIIMNPPFSASAGKREGERDTKTGARHVQEALDRLADGGRLVAIVGQGMADDRPAFKSWWNDIKERYTVLANVGVSGKGYAKYGTSFDNQILVINKTKPVGIAKTNTTTGNVESVADLVDMLQGVRDERGTGTATSESNPPERAQSGGASPAAQSGGGRTGRSESPGALPVGNVGTGPRPVREGSTSGAVAPVPGPAVATPAAVPANRGASATRGGGQRNRPGSRGKAAGVAKSQPIGSGGLAPTEPASSTIRLPDGDIAPVGRATANDNTADTGDDIYAAYTPQKISVPDAVPHPTPLVESAAMRSVSPPSTDYQPALPKSMLANGMPSLPQYEAVVYAGHAHGQILPNGQRKGFFIGDGCVDGDTVIDGTGKTIRELAEIGEPIRVKSFWDGSFLEVDASSPFLKGEDDMFEVVCEEGTRISVTANHRFLTSRGWLRLVDGVSCGDYLVSFHGLPQTNSDIFRSTQRASDQHLTRTPLSSNNRYFVYSCHDGEPPRSGQEIAQELSPLPSDALEHIPISFDADAPVISPKYNRHHQSIFRHSRNSSFPALNQVLSLTGSKGAASSFQESRSKSPELSPIPEYSSAHFQQDYAGGGCPHLAISTCLRPLSSAFVSRSSALPFSRNESSSQIQKQSLQSNIRTGIGGKSVGQSYEKQWRWSRIVSISFAGRKSFYDMHVPGPQNYLGNGIVNHNTGTGKTIELLAIYADNAARGRDKAIWLSEKPGLIDGIKGDAASMGINGLTVGNLASTQSKTGVINQQNGILFGSYKTVSMDFGEGGIPPEFKKGAVVKPMIETAERKGEYTVQKVRQTTKGIEVMAANKNGDEITELSSKLSSISMPESATKTRLDQLVEWAGRDFDGLLILDESHNAANAEGKEGKMGDQGPSKLGQAVVQIQERLPNARVVYASATGATEVENLAYATRLGIWGEGTPFSSKHAFFQRIKATGVSAMEIVARDLKAAGVYMARTLSFGPANPNDPADKGVEVESLEHALTPDQEKMYDKIADAWQIVFQNMNEVLEKTGGKGNGRAKAAAKSAFYGAQQRFFNQILTASQMPTVISDMQRELDSGNSILVQLTNTNEATQSRALTAAATDETPLEELDLSPKDILLQFLEISFPTTKFHPISREGGKVEWVPLVDSQGNSVKDPEAVAMKQRLLDEMARLPVPENPLEQILNHFGVENVAEITGRNQRVVYKEKNGEKKRVVESHGSAVRKIEAKDFNDGKRRILVFSDAGGTGFSYHADKRFKNQQRRIHYLVQAGWRADKAIQGLGRGHRSNQAFPPKLKLVRTNIEGHKRFISTIARRLSQLGALTSGERRTSGKGMFTDSDNLENDYAKLGLEYMITDALNGKIDDVGAEFLTSKLGFDNVTDAAGSPLAGAAKKIAINTFLNRILALRIADQNLVFGEFFKRMQALIQRAKDTETYDDGLQTLRPQAGGFINKTADEETERFPGIDEPTRIVEFEVGYPVALVDFDKAKAYGESPQFMQNRRSGRVYIVHKTKTTRTDKETGALNTVLSRQGIKENSHDYVTTVQLDTTEPPSMIRVGDIVDGDTVTKLPDPQNYYSRIMVKKAGSAFEVPLFQRNVTGYADAVTAFQEKGLVVPGFEAHLGVKPGGQFRNITEEEARNLWKEEQDHADPVETTKKTFLLGVLLPIWHRLGDITPRAFKVTTSAAETVLGIQIPSKQVARIKHVLGVNQAPPKPHEVFNEAMNDGAQFTLSNGWKIARRRVANEPRLEITGPEYSQASEMIQLGAFHEAVGGFKQRFFIPTDQEKGVAVLDSLLKRYPVVPENVLESIGPNDPDGTASGDMTAGATYDQLERDWQALYIKERPEPRLDKSRQEIIDRPALTAQESTEAWQRDLFNEWTPTEIRRFVPLDFWDLGNFHPLAEAAMTPEETVRLRQLAEDWEDMTPSQLTEQSAILRAVKARILAGWRAGEAFQEKSDALEMLDAAGFDKFLDDDLKPVVKEAKQGISEILHWIPAVFSPTSLANPAGVDAMHRYKGEQDKRAWVLEQTLKSIEHGFSLISQPQQVDFIDRFKTGQPQPTPYLRSVAAMLAKIDTDTWNEAHDAYLALGYKDADVPLAWLDNHFRVLWKTIPGSGESKKNVGSFSRRPLSGSKGMQKHHTLDDMSQGLAMGGVPYSYNPMTMFRRAQADLRKLVSALKMFKWMKDNGFVQWEKGKFPTRPDGFEDVDDPLFRRYFPTPAGLVEPGRYFIESNMARLLRNWLSRDLVRETSVGRGLMWLKNVITAAELAFSPFHFVLETLETASSSIGLGLSKMYNRGFLHADAGAVLAGLKDMIQGVTLSAVVTTATTGGNAMRLGSVAGWKATKQGQAFLKQFPNADKLLNSAFIGGMKLDEPDWKIGTLKTFVENVSDKNWIGATLRALPALNELAMKPLFEAYIPRLKLGIFMKEYAEALVQNQRRIAAGAITEDTLARETWKFVEDRFGEMNFDNLFWNRTFKAAVQLLVRSVTWKLGDVRAFGGAFTGQIAELRSALKERRSPMLHHNLSWLLGLCVLTSVIASMIQWMLTRKNPEGIRDLVYPQVDPTDPRVRLSLPTYLKDVFSATHDPKNFLLSSMSGWINRVTDIWRNKDFYGTKIYNEDDPIPTKAKDITEATLKNLEPFSARNYAQMSEQHISGLRRNLAMAGFGAAPKWITNSPAEQLASEMLRKQSEMVEGRTKQQAQHSAAVRDVVKSMQHGEPINPESMQKLLPGDVKKAAQRASMTPLQYAVHNLQLEEALAVMKVANPQEKESLAAIMSAKLRNSKPETRVKLQPKAFEGF